MVVLDQNPVVETRSMIHSAARTHGVLLERAKQWRRLAGIEDRYPPGCRIDKAPRQRGNAGEPLQEIERGPLRRKEAGGVAHICGDRRSRFAPGAVRVVDCHRHARIELTERFRGDFESGDDTGRLRQNDRPRLLLGIDGALGGDVAPAVVLGECSAHQLPIGSSVKRLEGHALHGRDSGGGSSPKTSSVSSTSANRRSLMWVAARKSRCAGTRPSNLRGSVAIEITAFTGFFSIDLMRRTSASAAWVASRTASAE